MVSSGIKVALPDINKSDYTFSPNVETNSILYGMSGITRVGSDLVKEIIANRPYKGWEDFVTRIKVNKPQMVNLIKSGAFDSFGERMGIMRAYINSISDTKKRITLQNMKMLIDFGLIPDEYDLQRRVFNFNKYLKKQKLGEFYGLDEVSFDFYTAHYSEDLLVYAPGETTSNFKIKQVSWDTIYQSEMNVIRPFVQKNAADLLEKVNYQLTKDMWEKYCLGTLSKWEMDSVSFYSHEHELAAAHDYRVEDFFKLSPIPDIERTVTFKGKTIPLFSLHRIAGTVLDRDKAKKIITLLTTNGVVTVKIYGGVFEQYDKQISEKGADGHKHIIEKSAFTRGNKIIVTGIREEDAFIAKVYKNTPYHRVEIITDILDDGTILTRSRGEE